MKQTIRDLDVYDKRILVRVDFNVPIKDGVITSAVRIDEALPTIKELLDRKAKVILCSHLGRPDGERNEKYSLKPVYEYLKNKLNQFVVKFCDDCIGEKAEQMSKELRIGEILVLENVRFYKEEEECEEDFSRKLSDLADIFVLDAFGTCHRKHASTYGVAEYLNSAVGLLVEKEINAFDAVLTNPKRPLVAVLGGAKISDKIDVTKNLLNVVDTLIIGGGMCFTFLKALKADVGKSLVDEEKLDFCYSVIKEALNRKVKIILPVDFVCSDSLEGTNIKTYKLGKIPSDMMGLDIGEKSIKLFKKYLKRARTIVWNGPMGDYENPNFASGTKAVAEIIAKNKKCFSVVGGGDVVSAVENFGFKEQISHISTGGGASLKLLEGKELKALTNIKNKR